MKVLVVESNLVMMEIISDVLKVDGFEVLAANNAELGNLLLEKDRPQITIYDVDIQNGNIAYFAETARTMGGMRIVAISSNNDSIPDNPVIVGRVIKPFKGSEVIAATRKAKSELDTKTSALKKLTGFLGFGKEKKEAPVEQKQVVTQGKSFIVIEPVPDKIYDVGKKYLILDSKLFVLTTSAIKSVKNRFSGLDIVVKGLSKRPHDEYIAMGKIGTIMGTLGDFAINNPNSTIIIEGLDELIQVHGSNTVITMVCQLIENGKKTNTTFLVSLKPGVLEDKDMQLLTHYMKVYDDKS